MIFAQLLFENAFGLDELAHCIRVASLCVIDDADVVFAGANRNVAVAEEFAPQTERSLIMRERFVVTSLTLAEHAQIVFQFGGKSLIAAQGSDRGSGMFDPRFGVSMAILIDPDYGN